MLVGVTCASYIHMHACSLQDDGTWKMAVQSSLIVWNSNVFLDEDRHSVSNTSAFWASHCAGDPIEVGAATAVLRGASCPVRFTAAKSRIGHAEPAAGLVGILHVSARLPSPPSSPSFPPPPCRCCCQSVGSLNRATAGVCF